jgi:hypothetical protein
MVKARKVATLKLTVAQVCMSANFADAAFDYPRESFAQVTVRMLGSKGFPKTNNGARFKRECRDVFNLERREA